MGLSRRQQSAILSPVDRPQFQKIIFTMGKGGVGKTTIAIKIAQRINSLHYLLYALYEMSDYYFSFIRF